MAPVRFPRETPVSPFCETKLGLTVPDARSHLFGTGGLAGPETGYSVAMGMRHVPDDKLIYRL